jgi:nitrous oxidase accessory protein
MSKHAAPLLALTLLAACFLYVPSPSDAANRTIIVPDDYPTISSAIENAVAGDTIIVKAGNYHEESISISKSISIIGEGIGNTILSLNPPLVQTWLFYNLLWIRATAITINAGNVKLQGFTLNLPSDEYGISSAIHAIGDGTSIVDNMVGNSSVYLAGSQLNVTGNSIPEALEVVGSNLIVSHNNIGKTLKIQGFYNLVSYNQIGNSYYWNGIHLNGSYNCILGNSFSTMEIDDSNSNYVVGNSFVNLDMTEYGKGSCNNNILSKNQVTGNGGINDGIWLYDGKNNTFSGNIISNCENGLTLGTSGSTAESNLIYLNNFVNNTNHVICPSGSNHTVNHFDNGSKGNYYDNYKGNDVNRDGVGDSPYTVQETHWDEELQHDVTIVFFQDSYPLMAPFDIDSLRVDLPDWAGAIDNSDSGSKPFPSMLVLAVAVVAVVVAGAGLLLYRKRGRGKT